MLFRIKIISPLKATKSDLARRQQRYKEYARSETVIDALNLDGGPASLNSSGDILTSAAAIFQQGATLTHDECDAILVDCVFDPAVAELFEATKIPTFGPTRTTLPYITFVANNFSIIARSRRQCELMADLVEQEGFGKQLHSIHALDISYNEAKQPDIFNKVMLERLDTAVSKNKAQAIMFGSTTMALTNEMRHKANGAPLFMPGMTCLRIMENLWFDGLFPNYSKMAETNND